MAFLPSSVIVEAVESLATTLRKSDASGRRCCRYIRPAVIPYVDKSSHNLKKVGSRYGVDVALSALGKLES